MITNYILTRDNYIAMGIYGNHVKACEALIARLGWGGVWYGGATASGYVFVNP